MSYKPVALYENKIPSDFKGLPKEVKTYFRKVLKKHEYDMLLHCVNHRRWVVLEGPVCSGKSSIRDILWKLGYPYVLDDGDFCHVIHTSRTFDDPVPIDDIIESLGMH